MATPILTGASVFALLCGVLLIGAGFVLWDLVHDQPKPLPATVCRFRRSRPSVTG